MDPRTEPVTACEHREQKDAADGRPAFLQIIDYRQRMRCLQPLSTARGRSTENLPSDHPSSGWPADTTHHFHQRIDGKSCRILVPHAGHTWTRDHQNLGGLGM